MVQNKVSEIYLIGHIIVFTGKWETVEILTFQNVCVQGQLTSYATKQVEVKCPSSWQTGKCKKHDKNINEDLYSMEKKKFDAENKLIKFL